MLNSKTIADAYSPLFELMQNEFGLTLLVSDMNEIINSVELTNAKISGLLKNTFEENKWNSCINSIPKDTATKIIVTDEGVVTIGWHWSGKGGGWKGDFIGNVTHWMDLPYPPHIKNR